MSEDCIFCQMVAGEIPSHQVYEDEDVFAFLDINPLAPGHTLVIPKAHHESMADLPEGLAGDLFGAVHTIVPAAEAAVDADASTIAVNNGEAAGQEVPHVHVHVVPRSEGDGGGPIHAAFGSRPEMDDDELADVADAIGDGL